VVLVPLRALPRSRPYRRALVCRCVDDRERARRAPRRGGDLVASLRRRARDRAPPHAAAADAATPRRQAARSDMTRERQHVWLGPEATSFDEPCELCLAAREALHAE